jgi:hypothetical protein
MDTNTTIVLVALILAIAGIAVALIMRKRQSHHLRSHFGAEYDRALEQTGDPRKAERELHAREKRVAKFELKPLEPADRARFVASWQAVQANFVDDPRSAVMTADDLLGQLMAARGYPVSNFEQRASDLSVDHPAVVQNYRAAHDIALRHQRGDAGTEDLRQAMIHYRALFEDLIGETRAEPPPIPPAGANGRASSFH